jgi:hypothetical protein
MREVPEFVEATAAWRNQLQEEAPVNLEKLQRIQTWELFSATRSEIIGSLAAALFFATVMAWRFTPERDRLVQFGCLTVIFWAAGTAFWFRRAIRHNPPQPDALAKPGLEHYRAELARRRNHLRNAWIWHGPLLLASLLSATTVAARIVPGRLWDALPLFLVLAAWAAVGMKRRLSLAADLQREIDEITGESPMEG